MKRALLFVIVLCCTSSATGGVLDDEYVRFGGGFGSVEAEGALYSTLQAFAGVDSVREGTFRAGVEISAMEAGETDADGLGAAGVFHWVPADDVNLFARAGADFGGDPGYLVGAGVGYFFERNMEVRFETVSRQRGSSVQFNLVFYPRLSPHP